MSVLLVTNGLEPGPAIVRQPWVAERIDTVDVYDLAGSAFESHHALWLTQNVDQRLLQSLAGRLTAYLGNGGTVVFCGHVAWPFLPVLREFVPLRDYGVKDLRVTTVAPHPIWAGIELDDLTFRRGVAGFYGRGHNTPPEGARCLNAIAGGTAPVDWLWEPDGGGRLLVHSGNDLWNDMAEGTSADRLPPALLDWSLA